MNSFMNWISMNSCIWRTQKQQLLLCPFARPIELINLQSNKFKSSITNEFNKFSPYGESYSLEGEGWKTLRMCSRFFGIFNISSSSRLWVWRGHTCARAPRVLNVELVPWRAKCHAKHYSRYEPFTTPLWRLNVPVETI